MSVIQNNLLMTPEGYQISRSVRLRSSATAYLSKATVGTPTNKSKWTMSMWVKRGALSSNYFSFFGKTINASANFSLYFNTTTDQIIWNFNNTYFMTTSQVFRDPSSWYHFVFVWDSANATAALRARIYCNGSEITLWATDNRANITTSMDCWNTNDLTYPHTIGAGSGSPASLYYDGYMTEVNFIDGQALTPSSFGETDAVTGVWKPKKYAGTYGTNGFYLNFSDNSAATATAIGKDMSGNANNWTPNNISVTAGVTYDSMLDVPTMWADGENGRGNYSVYNPLKLGSGGTWPVTDGNLAGSNVGSGSYSILANSIGVSSGKWYFEFTATNVGGGGNLDIGVLQDGNAFGGSVPATSSIGQFATGYAYTSNGVVSNNNTNGATYSTYTTNNVIQVALDLDNNKVYFGKNGTWQNSGNPAAGTGSIYTVTAGTYFAAIGRTSVSSVTAAATANFGQRPFSYTPPTGFKALNTQNLPDATIKKGSAYFNAALYTGNGGNQSITGVGFQPDLVWGKLRSTSGNHRLHDSVRGADNTLSSNLTDAEVAGNGLVSFDADGFTMDSGTNINQVYPYVAWNWKESVSAGFDIVTYTGTGANRTIAHSLGVAPKMIIAKHTNAVDNWIVYHASLGGSPDYLWLNLTSAKGTSSAVWNTAPTSSVFGVGTDNLTNISGGTYVAYLFAEVAGFSNFGSYTGNGSADGPFVYCGFRPRFVLVKGSSNASSWQLFDTSRPGYNANDNTLWADLSSAEGTGTARIDLLSNGFKVRAPAGTDPNVSSQTYIYAAFAENPFKNSLAR